MSTVPAPQKENQRVRITKKLLKDALIDILQTTPMQKVTISEICARAELNRTTFYKHYTDEISLYYDIQNEVLETLRSILEEHGLDSLEIVFTFIKENHKVSNVIFNANIDETLPQKIFALPEIYSLIQKEYKLPLDMHSMRMYYFICYGGYALIRDWVNSGYNSTPKVMADTIRSIVKKLLN